MSYYLILIIKLTVGIFFLKWVVSKWYVDIDYKTKPNLLNLFV